MSETEESFTLSNGAIELMRKKTEQKHIDVVLCLFKNEYVTWINNKEFDSYTHGNYFSRDLEDAMEDLKERE